MVTRVRRAFAGSSRRAQLDDALLVRSADDVTRQLGQMKGAAMKLGQMLSFVVDGLPPEAQASLAQLQAQVAPMSGDLAVVGGA